MWLLILLFAFSSGCMLSILQNHAVRLFFIHIYIYTYIHTYTYTTFWLLLQSSWILYYNWHWASYRNYSYKNISLYFEKIQCWLPAYSRIFGYKMLKYEDHTHLFSKTWIKLLYNWRRLLPFWSDWCFTNVSSFNVSWCHNLKQHSIMTCHFHFHWFIFHFSIYRYNPRMWK